MPLDKRLDEFVNYHIHGDGECNGMVLRAFADSHKLTPEERVDLAYMFSVTYCVESAIVLFSDIDSILRDADAYASKNKNKLIFQSDRKYVKMRNSFFVCLDFYRKSKNKIREICKQKVLDLNKWITIVENFPMFGRFSAYLFVETISCLLDKEIKNANMDWENGATATSGLFNLYYLDDYADLFDKERKLRSPFTASEMDKMLVPVLALISKRGGDANITKVETSLCAYRKFFKGSRYNGFYLDRMLAEIEAMREWHPDVSDELLKIRSLIFDDKYLGEVGGWTGIRTDCKKLYKQTGVIM